jgi:hypothetical protein
MQNTKAKAAQRQTKTSGNGSKNSARKNRRKRAKGLQRDPGRRGDVGLSLTRSQFTASSPLNLFEVLPASSPGGIRVKGRELISALSLTSTSTGAYQLLTNATALTPAIALNPLSFPRLAAYNSIYEMFVFHKANLSFMSNQPTTAAGEILACVDYDALDSGPASATAVMRNITSVMGNVYSDNSMQVVKSLSRLPRFLTGASAGSVVQNYQGMIYYAIEGYTGTAGDTVGYLVAEYEAEFFSPQ